MNKESKRKNIILTQLGGVIPCHATNQIGGNPMLCQMCACLLENLCARTTVDAEVEGLATEGVHRVVDSDLT
jgi:hypothetical protein